MSVVRGHAAPSSELVFKTIYFPRERCRSGTSARVTISLPAKSGGNGHSDEFLAHLGSLSSRQFRLALGDPFLEDLEARAEAENVSLSELCLVLLTNSLGPWSPTRPTTRTSRSDAQLALPWEEEMAPVSSKASPAEPSADLGVTFRESRRLPVHGWYPYVEGFSAGYVRDALLRRSPRPRAVYDPFGGCGTSQLTASTLGIRSFYSEVNPFMRFVAETKVTAAYWARQNLALTNDIMTMFIRKSSAAQLEELGRTVSLDAYDRAFPERDFFEEPHLRQLLAGLDLARSCAGANAAARDLLLLACASNAVHASNMTRRADLRRRRPDEYTTRVVDVSVMLRETVSRMLDDLGRLPSTMAPTQFISTDCRQIPDDYTESFDIAITSPPYLNGTNYFRNTKIELWLLNFITSEDDLAPYRRQAIAAGINNVTKSRLQAHSFDPVERTASVLDVEAGDRRIPALVRQYFSDMYEMLLSVHKVLTPGGSFLLDIGDSKFYGVHVPTDELLIHVARQAGFIVEQQHVLARRYSRDRSELKQVELLLAKPKRPRQTLPAETLGLPERAERFAQELPYKGVEYKARNWGHALHSLCSYQGKLKPSIAHWLVREFVQPGSRVLDPLGGVGTVPLEAALAGCYAVSNDKSPLAATVGAAKLAPPTLEDALAASDHIERRMKEVTLSEEDYRAATFGLNASVADYYHSDTLRELLEARQVFLQDASRTGAEMFVWACLLHILHGNRPYALSRTSHPITPFHPSGPAVYKSVMGKVKERLCRLLPVTLPATFRPGTGLNADFRDLPNLLTAPFDAIITSPPFLGMRFDRPNWLRLWFCGWDESDFHKTSLGFLERQQTRSAECYADFFETCRRLVLASGILIIHIGSGRKDDLVGDLRRLGDDLFTLTYEARENVEAVEQHGLLDKGRTTTHHFLFFEPRS